jgi:predicted RNase H-like HicB family nuclease
MNRLPTTELIFEVTQEVGGGYSAECLTEDIFTQGATWEALRENAREAVRVYLYDATLPQWIRLRFARDEVLRLA